MHTTKQFITRRKALQIALAIGGATLTKPIDMLNVLAEEAVRTPTPSNVIGPFYPVIKPLEKDADLTTIRGHKNRAEGKIIHLMGRVLNTKGEPVSGASVQIWQANTHGRYAHPSDPNPTPLDPNFQGYAEQITDKEGRYRFKTIKPGPYPVTPTWMRAPHIHFEVLGTKNLLATQMFFPGEPLNEKDELFLFLGQRASKSIAQILPPTGDVEADSEIVMWDIILNQPS